MRWCNITVQSVIPTTPHRAEANTTIVNKSKIDCFVFSLLFVLSLRVKELRLFL
jgi:hypothetical protein